MPRPLTDKDGEVRELTLAEMKRLRPIAEVDPGMVEAIEGLREQYIRASRTTRAAKAGAIKHWGVRPPTVKAKVVKAATPEDTADAAIAKAAKMKAAKAKIAKVRRAKRSAGPGPTRARA
jgi:hypothetical protein